MDGKLQTAKVIHRKVERWLLNPPVSGTGKWFAPLRWDHHNISLLLIIRLVESVSPPSALCPQSPNRPWTRTHGCLQVAGIFTVWLRQTRRRRQGRPLVVTVSARAARRVRIGRDRDLDPSRTARCAWKCNDDCRPRRSKVLHAEQPRTIIVLRYG